MAWNPARSRQPKRSNLKADVRMPNAVDIGKYRDKQARRIAEPVTALSDDRGHS